MKKIAQFIAEHAAALIIGAIALVSLILVIIVFTLASSVSGERRIIIEDISGNAFILKTDGQVSADRKMKLESGDVLITSAASSVKLSADKDKSIYIEPETTLYVYYTDTAEKGSIVVNISEGAAVCRLDSKLAGNAAFEVRTPNAVVSAAGTVFRTQFDYYDEYAGHSEVKLTEVQCAEGTVNIQLYDDSASPADQLMLLAEGKSARLMTNSDTARFEYLNSDTDINSFSEDALKTFIRIAAERRIGYSLTDLNNAYQRMLNDSVVTEPAISTIYPPAEESTSEVFMTANAESRRTETETSSETSTAQTAAPVSSETSATTVPTNTEPPESTAVSVTSPTTAIFTVSTTAPVTEPSSGEGTSPPPSETKTEAHTTANIPPIKPAETVTTSVTETEKVTTSLPPAVSESRTTGSSVPWWEIINSAALTSDTHAD